MGAPLGIVLLFLVTAVALLRAEGVEYQDTGFEDGVVKGGGVKGGGVKGGGEKDGGAEGGGVKDECVKGGGEKDGGVKGGAVKDGGVKGGGEKDGGVKGGGTKGGCTEEQCHDEGGHSPYEDDKGDTSGGVAGAGEPLEMARNAKDERRSKEEDKKRTERKKNERAPLACFVRAEAFERSGAQRFTVRTLPADRCTHIIYSYLETDNNTGEFMFRKRGQRGDMEILEDIGKLKRDSRSTNVKVLFSYGGGAHVQSLLNRIRDDKKANELVERIKSLLSKAKIDGINFHLEGPGPQVCKDDEIMTILKFFKESCVGNWINAGVPKYKIVPGIATHGRSFTLNDPAFNGDAAKLKENHPLGKAAEITKTDGYMNYVEVRASLTLRITIARKTT
ncbi:hypothetical protein V5799_013265 [Amblyomma americanum]|uniref:GH18 domain-containing protein n=1 Tax=Amblyomma americanum TaxID=6943 RepID=A0AAQ4E6G1_AMBAM